MDNYWAGATAVALVNLSGKKGEKENLTLTTMTALTAAKLGGAKLGGAGPNLVLNC